MLLNSGKTFDLPEDSGPGLPALRVPDHLLWIAAFWG